MESLKSPKISLWPLHRRSKMAPGTAKSKTEDLSHQRQEDTTCTSVWWHHFSPATPLINLGLFCPFAHRANLIRHFKGLTSIIPLSIVRAYPKGDEKGWPGWQFPTEEEPYEGSTADQHFGFKYLHELYFKDKKGYEGRYSVPVVWDNLTRRTISW